MLAAQEFLFDLNPQLLFDAALLAIAMPNHTPMEYAILSFTNHTPISSTITPYNTIETTSPGNASLILFNMVFFLFLLPV